MQGIFEYHILDNSGKVIQTGKYDGQINISNLEPGAYVLMIRNGELNKVLKVVVK